MAPAVTVAGWRVADVALILTLVLTLVKDALPQQQPHVVMQPTAKHRFQDSANSHYFRYFQLDSASGFLYVGALDYVYRLSLDDITKFNRSSKLNDPSDYESCQKQNKSDYQCRNHVRSILIGDDQIYVCSTNIHNTKSFNKATLIEQGAPIEDSKCSKDPDDECTSIYVRQGNAKNKPAMYRGIILPSGDKGVIARVYWPTDDLSDEFNLVTKISDEAWLKKPKFIGSFEDADHVYFFFREVALEMNTREEHVVSSVARICKKDQGTARKNYQWTSFFKARLNCSISGEYPFYFDYIRDVKRIKTTTDDLTFYGLFTTSSTGLNGSAVCEFTLTAISAAFNEKFMAQEDDNSIWKLVDEDKVPTNSNKCVNKSQELPSAVEHFVEIHHLMHDTVRPSNAQPLYYQADIFYTHMAVDLIEMYSVLYLATGGNIHKVVQWKNGSNVKRRLLTEWQIDQANPATIWQLAIHNRQLYVSQDHQISQYNVAQCNHYELCTDCILDPYCGWHIYDHKCVDYEPNIGSSLKRDVQTDTPLRACSTACRVDTHRITTNVRLPGDSIQLFCKSHCSSPENPISWDIFDIDLNLYRKIDFSQRPDMLLTTKSSIVLLNVTHNALLRCQIGSVTIAEHQIQIPDCADEECLWKKEFHKWCAAFDSYTKEFNEWMCLKNKCVDNDSCIPNMISGQCSGK